MFVIVIFIVQSIALHFVFIVILLGYMWYKNTFCFLHYNVRKGRKISHKEKLLIAPIQFQ